MDFNTFLNAVHVGDPITGVKPITIHPWMKEIRNHNDVIAMAPRQVGTTTYILISCLYDILFSNINHIRVVTYHGGYRKKHFIDSLITHYSWLMNGIDIDKREIRVTDNSMTIEGKGVIEVYGMHEIDAMRVRGKGIPKKIYTDICASKDDDVTPLLMCGVEQCCMFFQGFNQNRAINNMFDVNHNIDDMDKVCKILKGEKYWHTMIIPHNLTEQQTEQIKNSIGEERFIMEYGN